MQERTLVRTRPRPDALGEAERTDLFRTLGIDGLWMEFQPVVSLRDLSVVGVEALARFRGAREDPPDLWFARAEAKGLGESLEMEAVRLALARLPDIPEPLFLALNVSPLTALSPGLLSALVRHGERLVVEITEHTPVLSYDNLRLGMKRLRALGVRVAVDDAGAGFAGLAHVVRVVPDLIKLDLRMVTGIEHDQAKRATISAVSVLAGAMGAAIVAEGIETREQLDALFELGVEYGQGFHLSRPRPLEDLADAGLLTAQRLR